MKRLQLNRRRAGFAAGLLFALLIAVSCTPSSKQAGFDVQEKYEKFEYQIPMRDGAKLYTAVYVPRDKSQKYPFLMKRSPYGSWPYGKDKYPDILGPRGSSRFAQEGYIFVYQDVRGRYMSEGHFLHMTPHIENKQDSTDVDESTDTYDTVEWLLQNVQPNNGRVGLWGISYPGFYVAASIINTHPAIKAASPQAAIGDWFVGDDFHHHGVFFLQDGFRFFRGAFGVPHTGPSTERASRFDFGMDDAYRFLLELGPLPNANEKYFHHTVAFWDTLMTYGTYSEFWQKRNIIPHMKNVTAAVMNVAGFYDAEDPYGPIQIYHSIEKNNPGITNILVAGPWFHGGWVRSDGDYLGNVSFGSKTSRYYQQNVDLPFFNFYLKDKGTLDLPEVLAYASGSNEWHRFESWPPPASSPVQLYFQDHGGLAFTPPATGSGNASDAYLSDPAKPVPYTQEITIRRTREYMVEDQRFAARRPDVLVYQTPPLQEDVTLAGPIHVNLFVSTTGTDADFVVKLIDVYPDDAPETQKPEEKYMAVPMSGYQMLVRPEIFRGKFRNSYAKPEPFSPGKITPVRFATPNIFHTFKAGHRIMVQVQSSWFPIADRNPQTFVDIYSASEADFQKATHRIYRSARYPSHLEINRLPN